MSLQKQIKVIEVIKGTGCDYNMSDVATQPGARQLMPARDYSVVANICILCE